MRSTQLLATSCSSSVADSVTMTNEWRDTRRLGPAIASPEAAPAATATANVASASHPRRRLSSALA